MSQLQPSATAPLVHGLREQIADRIRNDVICGRIGVGERLNEVQLGEKSGVSRAPVRAAHRSIVRRAHERDLESIWNSIVGRVRSHFRDTHQDQYPDAMEIYAEHVGIIDSFKGGDVKRAVALLKEKIC